MGAKMERPWFQYHLSTLVVATLLASVFLGANMVPGFPNPAFIDDLVPHFSGVRINPDFTESFKFQGWPFRFQIVEIAGPGYYSIVARDRPRLLVDVAIAIVSVFGIAFVLEWRIRRRQSPDGGRQTTDNGQVTKDH